MKTIWMKNIYGRAQGGIAKTNEEGKLLRERLF